MRQNVTEGFDGQPVTISARCCLSYSCYCCCCRRSPDVLGSGPAGLLACRHASCLPDPDFASSPAGSTRGSTPPTPLSHPPPCPHHHHDIDIDIDIDIAGMLLYEGTKIHFTYLTGKLKEYLCVMGPPKSFILVSLAYCWPFWTILSRPPSQIWSFQSFFLRFGLFLKPQMLF